MNDPKELNKQTDITETKTDAAAPASPNAEPTQPKLTLQERAEIATHGVVETMNAHLKANPDFEVTV
jgi:hypothetical protein